MRILKSMASVAVLCGIVGPASSGFAQERDSVAAEDTFGLGVVEITGTRLADTPTTQVVTAETFAAMHRDDLAEALDLVPGISVQNLGQRRERLITLRGFSSRQVPLFIDGVPVYVPYDGNVDLARFGVDYVSSIVVGKGLTSLLYGPNILGGAVNVISRKPIGTFEASGRVEAESDDHWNGQESRITGSLGGRTGSWYGHITASHAASDGYRLPSGFVPVAAEDGGERNNAQSSDTVVSAKIGFEPDEDNEFALSYYRQDGDKNDPPYAGSYLRAGTRPDGVQVRFWNWPYWNKQSFYLVARNAVTSQGTLRWRVFHDSFRNALESYNDATYTAQTLPFAFHGSNYDDYTYGGSADFEWRWNGSHSTRAATHYRQDVHREAQIAPALPQQRLDIPTYDFALEHEWRVTDRFVVTPSWSHMLQPDRTVQVYNSNTRTFSPVTTAKSDADNEQLVLSYDLGYGGSLVGGVSHKTRFPTIKERFSGGLGAVVPNPTLEPETATHYELGYDFKAATWGAKIALFSSRITDAIQSVGLPQTACTVPPCTQLQNIGRQRNRGFELSGDWRPDDAVRISGQINVADIDNLSAPTVRVQGAPKYKYLLSGDFELLPELLRLRVDGQHESSRFSNSAGTRVANSITLVNSFLRLTPLPKLGVEFGVRNLTDELYAYEEGFYEAGRTFLAQVDFRFY